MNDANYKTVIVLDHGPFFASSCGEETEIDPKTKQNEEVNVFKSLWTCNVEVTLEYLRIITDLFPESRFLRFVVSDFVGRFLTTGWLQKLQALEHVLESFAQIGAPDAESDPDTCVILNGLSLAVEALTQVTDVQKSNKKSGRFVRNCGRIVVFTHLKQDEEIETIENSLFEEIENRNKLAKNLDDNFLPLDYVELCLLNIFPAGSQPAPSLSSNRPLRKVSECLWSEFINSSSGKSLASCIQALVLKHYNLASTTVTGIPMKEEQTSGSSVNYDVNLLHEKRGHDELRRAHYLDKEMGLLTEAVNDRDYETLMLKWCSPNVKPMIGVDHFHMTSCAVRVSPASVNSRPSACLTSFILGGRTVMLEIPKKTPGSSSSACSKVISHLLSAHGGHIYIHSVTLGKSPLDEPPSISEGPGGRITDYRISNFGELMKECCLAPGKPTDEKFINPKTHLQELTKFWPLTMGESLIFSCPRFEPLLTSLKSGQLTEANIKTCKQIILGLINAENRNEALFSTTTHCPRVKGLKREEQYRIAWDELEQHIRNYSHVSTSHFSILNCLLQCQGKTSEIFTQETTDSCPYQSKCEIKIEDEHKGFVVVSESKDSPISPGFAQPPLKKQKQFPSAQPLKTFEKINLLNFWIENFEKVKWKGWKDFERRCEGVDNKVELYPKLMLKLQEQQQKEANSST